ncbi:MAG TPA: LamG-like jellyroll fold domain-containing protein [Verrucomicrobiae bacterium]|nr:LamG-like jellyroll fold domain-containing protein [Verrucomicrobiae bacterium]
MRIALLPSIVGCLVLVQSTQASLVAHWTFSEGSGDQIADSSGYGNNGTIVNLKSNTWTAGIAGQALYFDGTTGAGSTYVSIPDSPSLAITSAISFAAWARVDDIYRDAPILDKEGPGLGRCYWFGADGGAGMPPDNDLPGKYGLLLNLTGNTGNSGWSFWGRNQGNLIAGQWIHLATTWDGTNIVYYTNGVAFQTVPFSGTLNVSSAFLSIGVNSLFNDRAFDGAIADVRLYNNALTASDVAALALAPPYIDSQPVDQTVINGNTAAFSVVAGGTSPLTYQWSFNGTNILGATSASLILTNVQVSQAGSYSVRITNIYGAINSTGAILTVNPVPSIIQAAALNATSGIVVVPINLLSQGNENALQFSISFDPTLLTYIGATLGGGAKNGSLLANLNQIGSGKLGLLISLPSDTTFSAGTRELAEVRFFVAPVTNINVVAVSFGDQPTPRQVSSPLPSFLSAAYINGSIVIPPLGVEGDVFPIPNGDGSVGAIDVVEMGRFVAGLDVITNASEFQRADCAPRDTLGDGQLTVADWVQAGRYAAVLDPLVAAGGPTQPQRGGGLLVKGGPRTGTSRTLIVPPAAVQAGQSFQLPVQLASQGDENGLEFSLVFDSSKLGFVNTVVGSNASGASMRVNTNSAAAGSLGIVMTLPTGATFAVATQEVARVTFSVAPSASGNTSVSFGAQPLPQQIVSSLAVDLPTSYLNDAIAITAIARPTLNAVAASGNLSLSWPVSANGFGLESSTSVSSTNWTSVLTAPVTNASVVTVTVPATTPQNFYRLRLP